MTDGVGADSQTPVRRVPTRGSAEGGLSVEQVRRLAPHLEARRVALGVRTEQAPTHNTYAKIMRVAETGVAEPVLKSTCANIDRKLAGPHADGVITPDGLWLSGTALALATGRINDPSEMPGYAGPRAAPAPAAAGDASTVYVLNGKILTKLPGATPEKVAAVEALFARAWEIINEEQGRT